MRKNVMALTTLALMGLAAGPLRAQDPASPEPPRAEPTAVTQTAPAGQRAIEGHSIINLPSFEVEREGTLTILFTHRFQQPVQDSTIHDLYSFDKGANIGSG